jgi:thiopeptide-type bacteriocin biosynthesis protein
VSEAAKPPAYKPASRFVLRTPLLPFATIATWTGDLAGLRAALRAWLDDPAIREAVFIASPELDTQLAEWREQPDSPAGQGVERALVRYLTRMAARATPFGMFSGVSVGRVGAAGDATRLELAPRAQYRRHTRLDNDYLFAACTDLAAVPEIRAALRYRPNTSLYRTAGRLRYAEGRLAASGRSYHLVAVDPTDYLASVLERARDGATIGELADVLCADPDITREEAEAFVGELIDAQLVVSALRPAVTGVEPTIRAVRQLSELPTPAAQAASVALGEADAAIDAIDALPPGVSTDQYRAVAEGLRAKLTTKVELSRMFQVDLFKPAPELVLGSVVVNELARGFELLRQVTPSGDEDAFTRFRQQFETRYEGREMPLVEVLDEEAGIGFSDTDPTHGGNAPLLAGLGFPGRPAERRVPFSRRDAHLLRMVDDVTRSGAVEVELTDDDLEVLSRTTPLALGDTCGLTATIIAPSAAAVDEGKFTIKLNGLDGGPGARMLGRFCHGSPEVTALAGESIDAEHALEPDAIFAEIVHLPEGRIGNILLRPVLRPYEIVYLGDSGAPPDRQLLVTDLMVRVAGGKVILRSRSLNKRVIPRMTTAHNYSNRSLGVYRFLCSLGQQDGRGAGWSWGVAGEAPFLPRVRRGRLVLSRARWSLVARDLEPLAEAAKGKNAAKTPEQIRALRAKQAAAVAALRERRRLPRWVVVADYDNELPVDLDNPLMVESFFDLVKGRPQVSLHELLPGEGEHCVHGPEGMFAHEIVLPYARVAAKPADAKVTAPEDAARAAPRVARALPASVVPVERRFPPGSAWLYCRVYTGTATVDALLRDVVGPLARAALAEGLAERWFFLRYGDPEWHLRLRFAGDPAKLVRELLPRMHAAFAPAGADGLFWRFELGTYEREIERYGGHAGIELAEQLFAADSEAVLQIVEASSGDEGAEAAWRLTLRGLDRLLGDLGLDTIARRDMMTRARDGFGAEQNMNTALQKQLGEKYRAYKDEIAALLAAADDDEDHPYSPGLAAFAQRSAASAAACAELRRRDAEGMLTSSVGELAHSFAHMHVNRMLTNSARAQELVLYDLLRRHYDGVVARARAAAKKT